MFEIIKRWVATIMKYQMTQYEEPCEITGGPCEWVYDYDDNGEGEGDEHNAGDPYDYDLTDDDLHCRSCFRWRDWDKEEFPTA